MTLCVTSECDAQRHLLLCASKLNVTHSVTYNWSWMTDSVWLLLRGGFGEVGEDVESRRVGFFDHAPKSFWAEVVFKVLGGAGS